jgi:hypothetical protein
VTVVSVAVTVVLYLQWCVCGAFGCGAWYGLAQCQWLVVCVVQVVVERCMDWRSVSDLSCVWCRWFLSVVWTGTVSVTCGTSSCFLCYVLCVGEWRRGRAVVAAPVWWVIKGVSAHLQVTHWTGHVHIVLLIDPLFFASFNDVTVCWCCIMSNGRCVWWCGGVMCSKGMCCKTHLGGVCEMGLRCCTYYVLSGSVLSVWTRVENILTLLPGQHNARLQIVRLRTADRWRLVG